MTATGPILVAGKHGQLARCLVMQAAQRAVPLLAVGRPEFDLTDTASIDRTFAAVRPCAVVNAAAYTAVDRAETDVDAAFAVNEAGAERLAVAAATAQVPFIHLSTDYVFDGRKRDSYVEDDVPSPLGVYGRSKLAGEIAVRKACPAAAIVRTAWIYSAYGTNFVRTMLRLAAERPIVRVVADQHGTPTSAHDLAGAILDMIERPAIEGKLYHLTGSGETTWYGFAEAVFAGWARRGRGIPQLERITTADYQAAAPRPANSRLDCSKIERELGIRLPDWHTSLEFCLETLARDGAEAPASH
jgi:dTDP-4-dehydrorhamnose reductase